VWWLLMGLAYAESCKTSNAAWAVDTDRPSSQAPALSDVRLKLFDTRANTDCPAPGPLSVAEIWPDFVDGAEVGVTVAFFDGEAPEGLTLPGGAVTYPYAWWSRADSRGEGVDFDLEVTPVGTDGTLGEPWIVTVAHTSGGCSALGRGGSWGLWVVGALVVMGRRRAARARHGSRLHTGSHEPHRPRLLGTPL